MALSLLMLMMVLHPITSLPQFVSDPEAVCDKLDRWIRKNGGNIDGVACRTQPETGGRGLIATKAIPYRQTYITVPQHCWMFEPNMKKNCTIGKILDTDPVIRDRCGKTWGAAGEPCRLILSVMYERLQPNSFWKPYLDSWPEHPTSPVWWSEKDLDDLESPHVKEEIQDLQNYMAEHHEALFPYLIKKYPEHFDDRMTLELLTWTALHVYGRAFDASAQDPKRPKRRTWAMIPFADLVNHGSNVESFYGDNKAKGPFSCWATQCFHKGAEIFQSYGSHRSSTHFFIYYGFVPTGYFRADYIAFRLPKVEWAALPRPSSEFKKPSKNRMIGFAGIDGRITERYIHAFQTVLKFKGKIDTKDLKETHGFKTTLQIILDTLNAQMKKWKTTRKQDFDELAKPFENYDKWAKLTFRSRYKFIFERVKENLEHRIKTNPSSARGWLHDEMSWSMVYDSDEVSEVRAESAATDSMFVLDVSIPE